MTEKILTESKIRTYQRKDMGDAIHIWKECGLIRIWNNSNLDIQRKVKTQNDLFVVPEHRTGGAAVALIKAVHSEAKAQRWGVLRWINRDNKYRARGLNDKLAEKTDWVTYEMIEVAAK